MSRIIRLRFEFFIFVALIAILRIGLYLLGEFSLSPQTDIYTPRTDIYAHFYSDTI